MTTTPGSHHIIVLLEYHIAVLVEIQQRYGHQSVRHAARQLGSLSQPELVRYALDGRVIGGSLVLSQREVAVPFALERVVALRTDDPRGPADALKVYVQVVSCARAVSGGLREHVHVEISFGSGDVC